MVDVPSLEFKPTGPEGKNWVALVIASPATAYNITLGSITQETKINAKIITVDNSQQNGAVQVNFGNYNFAVLPYTREDFEIPPNAQRVTVTVTAAALAPINVWISDVKLAKDQSNNLLIQQTAALTLTYAYVTYSVSTAQAATDLNKQVRFAGQVGAINYTLQAISGNVGNGWFQFIENDGAFAVSVVPSGADTIEGVFNAGAPMVLNPGDSGILSSDGVSWYFQGTLSYDSGDIAIVAGAASTLNHGLGKLPDVIIGYLICRTADVGYSVGERVLMNELSYDSGVGTSANQLTRGIVPSTTQLYFIQSNQALVAIATRGTGARNSLTAASWRYTFKLRAFY